jgi:hypothetical protein
MQGWPVALPVIFGFGVRNREPAPAQAFSTAVTAKGSPLPHGSPRSRHPLPELADSTAAATWLMEAATAWVARTSP